jgi:hypothetical protein
MSKLSVDDKSEAYRFDQIFSLDTLLKLIIEILEIDPNVYFYVASNNLIAINNLLKNAFISSRIIYVSHNTPSCNSNYSYCSPTSNRSSVFNIQLALVDFYLLAASKIILHPRGSSFAREAAFYNQTPLVDIYFDSMIYTLDTDLQSCGLDEYLRLNTNYTISCYMEPGMRKMCTRAIPLISCSEILEFKDSKLEDNNDSNFDTKTFFRDKSYCISNSNESSQDAKKYILAESNGYSL